MQARLGANLPYFVVAPPNRLASVTPAGQLLAAMRGRCYT